MIRVQLRDAIAVGRTVLTNLEDPKDGAISTADPTFVALTLPDGRCVRVPWSNVRCVLDDGEPLREEKPQMTIGEHGEIRRADVPPTSFKTTAPQQQKKGKR